MNGMARPLKLAIAATKSPSADRVLTRSVANAIRNSAPKTRTRPHCCPERPGSLTWVSSIRSRWAIWAFQSPLRV